MLLKHRKDSLVFATIIKKICSWICWILLFRILNHRRSRRNRSVVNMLNSKKYHSNNRAVASQETIILHQNCLNQYLSVTLFKFNTNRTVGLVKRVGNKAQTKAMWDLNLELLDIGCNASFYKATPLQYNCSGFSTSQDLAKHEQE